MEVTHTTTEIAAMIERLKLFARIEDGGGSCDLQFQTSPSREAATMLRDVAAERDAMAVNVRAMQKTINRQTREAKHLREKYVAAEAERDRLAAMVEKLRGYAEHYGGCDINLWNADSSTKCSCGLSGVLRWFQFFFQRPPSAPTDVKP